jgi:hypothetical protein
MTEIIEHGVVAYDTYPGMLEPHMQTTADIPGYLMLFFAKERTIPFELIKQVDTVLN